MHVLLFAATARALATTTAAPPTPPKTAPVTAASLRLEHDAEVRAARATWRCADAAPPRSYADDDFVAWRVVDEGAAGPDERELRGGHAVYATKEPVVTAAECDALVAEAQASIDAKGADDPRRVIGEAAVSELPRASAWLRTALVERFYPLLASRYGVAAEALVLYESLLLKYEGPSTSQPMHRDASLVSLNVVLTEPASFAGGGTYFEGLERGALHAPGRGCAVCHNSGVQHAGHAVAAGTRWVLVLFVLADGAPQLARRAKAHGIARRGGGDLAGAAAALHVGLAAAPADHQLHLTLASVERLRGDAAAARRSLAAAGRAYRYCAKARLELGRLLLEDRRPRAALRAYESALADLDGRDGDGAWLPLRADAWDARVMAARCAVLCCDAEHAGDAWRRAHLPAALDRLRAARAAAPDDPRLAPLEAHAADLLRAAADGAG